MKVFWKMLAVFAAIAAVAAAVYCFRDKLKAMCPCCKKGEFHPVKPMEEQELSQEESPEESTSEEKEEISSEDFAD